MNICDDNYALSVKNILLPFDFQAGVHARIQIYWCRSSIFRHLKLELLTQFPASNDEKYINVVYIWRKFVSFYGYVHWRMTTCMVVKRLTLTLK